MLIRVWVNVITKPTYAPQSESWNCMASLAIIVEMCLQPRLFLQLIRDSSLNALRVHL